MEREDRRLSDEEFIKRVERAAREGARSGSGNHVNIGGTLKSIVQILFLVIIVVLAYRVNQAQNSLTDAFQIEDDVEDHDLTLENEGILGYTVADFQEAILGEKQQESKLEVMTQDVSDVSQITDTGLGKLKMFTKVQYITYHGTATYTVDLSGMDKNDIALDEENMVVTLQIPHAQLEPINIQSDQIEFGDIKRGLLAIGDMGITGEQMAQVQTEAQKKMEEKLEEDNTIANADEFAIMSVWKIYQPIVNSVGTGYSLEVKFTE